MCRYLNNKETTAAVEVEKQADPSSLCVVRVRVRYLQPVCEDPSMRCSINSAVCMCVTVHPCCFQTGPKMLHPPTGTGQNQWLCACVCVSCTFLSIAFSNNLEIDSRAQAKRISVSCQCCEKLQSLLSRGAECVGIKSSAAFTSSRVLMKSCEKLCLL